jgi:four helix bundle protein
MSDFKKLEVWQKGHTLSLCIHRVCTRMRAPLYSALKNQLFRAAMSIPANIAEGRRQKSEKEFARFLGYALNSSSELEYLLIVARDTNVIDQSDYTALVSQTITVRKMLYTLLKKLSTPDANTEVKSAQPKPVKPTAPGR